MGLELRRFIGSRRSPGAVRVISIVAATRRERWILLRRRGPARLTVRPLVTSGCRLLGNPRGNLVLCRVGASQGVATAALHSSKVSRALRAKRQCVKCRRSVRAHMRHVHVVCPPPIKTGP